MKNGKKSNQMGIKEVAFLSTQIGFSVSFATIFFVGGGRFLDLTYGLTPIFTLLGLFLGLSASLFLVWKMVMPLLAKHKLSTKNLIEKK